MDKKRNLGYILIPLVLAIGVVGGVYIGKYLSVSRISSAEAKLRTIADLIENEYVDDIDVDSLLASVVPELLAGLDPHSVYMSAEELRSANEDMDGHFSGVGVSFQIVNDSVVVVDVIAGGPAEKVGLLIGDKIVAANDSVLTGKKANQENVFKTLRGPKGSKVALKVKRSSSDRLLDFDVIRDDIPVNSVDAVYIIDEKEGIGYLKVSKFGRNTYEEFMTALYKLIQDGAKSFIIDLRGNAGGFLDQVILMANEFLPEDRIIVSTNGKLIENRSVAMSDGGGRFLDIPLTVLIDEYSASASEIFAGRSKTMTAVSSWVVVPSVKVLCSIRSNFPTAVRYASRYPATILLRDAAFRNHMNAERTVSMCSIFLTAMNMGNSTMSTA